MDEYNPSNEKKNHWDWAWQFTFPVLNSWVCLECQENWKDADESPRCPTCDSTIVCAPKKECG